MRNRSPEYTYASQHLHENIGKPDQRDTSHATAPEVQAGLGLVAPEEVHAVEDLSLAELMIMRADLSHMDADNKEARSRQDIVTEAVDELLPFTDDDPQARARQTSHRSAVSRALMVDDSEFAKIAERLERQEARRQSIPIPSKTAEKVRAATTKTASGAKVVGRTAKKATTSAGNTIGTAASATGRGVKSGAKAVGSHVAGNAQASYEAAQADKEARRDAKEEKIFRPLINSLVDLGLGTDTIAELSQPYDTRKEQILNAQEATPNFLAKRLIDQGDMSPLKEVARSSATRYVNEKVDTGEIDQDEVGDRISALAADIFTYGELNEDERATVERALDRHETESRTTLRSRVMGRAALVGNGIRSRYARVHYAVNNPSHMVPMPQMHLPKMTMLRNAGSKVSDIVAETYIMHQNRREAKRVELAHMSPLERQEYERAHRNRKVLGGVALLGGAAAIFTAAYLSSRGFHVGGNSSHINDAANNHTGGTEHFGVTHPGGGLDQTPSQDVIPSHHMGVQIEDTNSYNVASPKIGLQADVVPHGASAVEHVSGHVGLNDFFTGHKGGTEFNEHGVTSFNEWAKGHKVKSGESIWNLSQKYLQAKGNTHPSISQLDAVKDGVLKDYQSRGIVGANGFLNKGDIL